LDDPLGHVPDTSEKLASPFFGHRFLLDGVLHLDEERRQGFVAHGFVRYFPKKENSDERAIRVPGRLQWA
jgi:hypothetical protein